MVPVSRRRSAGAVLTGTALNTAIVAVQAIVLVPIYLTFIGPRMYGAWLATGDVLVWVQLLDLGIPNLMIQRIGSACARGAKDEVGAYFANGLLILAGTSLALGLVAATLAPYLVALVGIQGPEAAELVGAFRLATVASCVVITTNGVSGLARGIQSTAFLSAASVVGTLTGIVVSLVAIYNDAGVFAIALGLVARAIVVLIASTGFAIRQLSSGIVGPMRINAGILREFFRATPSTTIGGLAFAVINQTENFIVALVLRPELVPLLSITKRAADVARGLLDTIGYASYGGFAHLVESPDRHRARQVRHEILSVRLGIAIVAAATFIVANRSFVSVWVGPEFFAGQVMTVLIGLQLIISGQSFLSNYLYRASGSVEVGSWLLAAEGAVRAIATVIAVRLLGLPGIPVAAIAVSAFALAVNNSRADAALAKVAAPPPQASLRPLLVYLTLLGMAVAFGSVASYPSWVLVVAIAGSTGAIAGGVLLWLDPNQASMRTRLSNGLLRTLRPSQG